MYNCADVTLRSDVKGLSAAECKSGETVSWFAANVVEDNGSGGGSGSGGGGSTTGNGDGGAPRPDPVEGRRGGGAQRMCWSWAAVGVSVLAAGFLV